MKPPLPASRWVALLIVIATSASFGGVFYIQSLRKNIFADEISVQTTARRDELQTEGEKSICISGITFNNREDEEAGYSPIVVRITNAMKTSVIEIPMATVDQDGILKASLTHASISDKTAYKVTIKPSGYINQVYKNQTAILSKCIEATEPFRLGDLNNDGRVTKTDVTLATQAYQGRLNATTKGIFSNQPPPLKDVVRVTQEFNSKSRDER
jgi:hypothetical protein